MKLPAYVGGELIDDPEGSAFEISDGNDAVIGPDRDAVEDTGAIAAEAGRKPIAA